MPKFKFSSITPPLLPLVIASRQFISPAALAVLSPSARKQDRTILQHLLNGASILSDSDRADYFARVDRSPSALPDQVLADYQSAKVKGEDRPIGTGTPSSSP